MLGLLVSLVQRVPNIVQEPGGVEVTPSSEGMPGVEVTPSSEGMPGADLIQQILDWTQMVALWGSLGALLAGAAIYGLAREGGNYGAAHRGKSLALGGVVGALLAGLAPTAVNLLFDAASS